MKYIVRVIVCLLLIIITILINIFGMMWHLSLPQKGVFKKTIDSIIDLFLTGDISYCIKI